MCFEKALDSFCDLIIMEKLAASPTNADTIVSLFVRSMQYNYKATKFII